MNIHKKIQDVDDLPTEKKIERKEVPSSGRPLVKRVDLSLSSYPLGNRAPRRSISTDKLQTAMQMCMNNSKYVLRTEEAKAIRSGSDDAPLGSFIVDQKVADVARAMLGTAKYPFRLVRVSTMTTGSAALNVFISTALSNYLEGSVLTALFDECKLARTRIELIPAPTITGSTAFDYYVGFRNQQDLVAPTMAAVARLPGSDYHICYPGPVPQPATFNVGTDLLKQRPWGLTALDLASTSTSAITAGCLGQFEIANGGFTVPSSTLALGYRIISVAWFTRRT
jgi:hypothetical protein